MLNRQLKWSLIVIGIGSIAIFVVSYTELSNICSLRQLDIEGEIEKYAEKNDPLTCDALNAKISQFNSQCKSDVEELDCG